MDYILSWDTVLDFVNLVNSNIGSIADWIGVLGAFSAIGALYQLLMNKKERKRLMQKVSVVLKCKDDERTISPLMIVRRKDITRAELQGILGTIKLADGKTSRYRISHTNSSEFWADIEKLQKSNKKEGDVLVIPCSAEEIEQFDPDVIHGTKASKPFPDVVKHCFCFLGFVLYEIVIRRGWY